jgi:thioredoxin reductase
VTTSRDRYETRAVLLAIGRRGTPRKLNVPGEDRPKVVYRLIDPQQYGGRRVLVVGGGDSAIEAATSLARVAGTEVTLSYRGDAFGRARAKNRAQLNQEVKAGRIDLRLGSEVVGIGPDEVEIRLGDKTRSVPNDAVIVCAGGVLPTEFLRSVGISIETKYGTA